MAISISLEKSSKLIHSSAESQVTTQVKNKKLALAITLVVVAVLLIVAALVTLFALPHFGMHITPLFSLLAIPLVVGLVKMAIAIFILHKPEGKVMQSDVKKLEDYFIETTDQEGGRKMLIPLPEVVGCFQEHGIVEGKQSSKMDKQVDNQ